MEGTCHQWPIFHLQRHAVNVFAVLLLFKLHLSDSWPRRPIPHSATSRFAPRFCTKGTFCHCWRACPVALWRGAEACCLGKKKNELQHVWQTLYRESLHSRGLPRWHSSMLPLSMEIPTSPSHRCSGYKSIEGNYMQMWPSVKLPISLQFRTVCSIFI